MGSSGRLYVELGVAPDCSDEDLDRAYRRRRAQVHPDRLEGDEGPWRRLAAVWAVLGMPASRHLYDAGFTTDEDVLPGDDVMMVAELDQLVLLRGGTVVVRGHDVVVPPGSAPGERVRVAGAGAPGSPPGDLVVVLQETGVLFQRRGSGRDLEVTLPVTWLELYRRDVLEVTTPWGARLVELPGGPLPPQVLRLPGYGVRRGADHGDLLVRLLALPPPGGDQHLLRALTLLQAGAGARLREKVEADARLTTPRPPPGEAAPSEAHDAL